MFSTLWQHKEHIEELNEMLEQWTAQHSPEEVMNLLQGVGVVAGVVKDARELAEDPQLAACSKY